MVTAQYIKTGTSHIVEAAGGAADGSLYGFYTLCGRMVRDPDAWLEKEGAQPTCGSCQEFLPGATEAAERRKREIAEMIDRFAR